MISPFNSFCILYFHSSFLFVLGRAFLILFFFSQNQLLALLIFFCMFTFSLVSVITIFFGCNLLLIS